MEKRFEMGAVNFQKRIIVITGAESTGKSTLAENLAGHFSVPYIPEIAREYIEKLNRKYNYNDVQEIAKLQVEQLNKAIDSDFPFVFLDTWLIITKIWFEVVFKKEPEWLTNTIRKTAIDLFLICDTDIPWVPDSVRENGGEKRIFLHKKYIETINKFNFQHKIVKGENNVRLQNALIFINELR